MFLPGLHHGRRCVVALGLLAFASATQAAPLRTYTVTDIGLDRGTGLDNDGNVIAERVKTIREFTPPPEVEFHNPLNGAPIAYWTVQDSTPDGRFLISGAVVAPYRYGVAYVYDPTLNLPPYASLLTLRGEGDWKGMSTRDMNDSGEVVGVAKWGTDPERPFYAEPGSDRIRELLELFPAGSGWDPLSVYSINDLGQILGYGINPEGERSKFILTPNPVPEPGTWAVFALAAAAAGWRMRRRAG